MTGGGREPVVLPGGLRDRVLEAARQARAAGRSTPEAMEISPAEAFSRAADAFDGLLRALGDEDWRRTVLRGLDVQALVGHLIGVEEDVQRCLSGDPEVAEGRPHRVNPACGNPSGRVPSLPRPVRSGATRPARTLGLVNASGDPGAEVAMHGMRLPAGALLVVRAFELWTHDNDIRRAAGLPASVPDPSTLAPDEQSSQPGRCRGPLRPCAGLREPVNVHLVLTGPGGGTWDVELRLGVACSCLWADPVDAVGFSRLIAKSKQHPGPA